MTSNIAVPQIARKRAREHRPRPLRSAILALVLDRDDVALLTAILRPWRRRHPRATALLERLGRRAAA